MPDSALSPTVQFDLSNKVAVITGASKGIGESIARLLAAGAKVVVSSRKQDAVDEVAGSIRAAGGEAISVAAPRGRHGPGEDAGRQNPRLYGGVDIWSTTLPLALYLARRLNATEAPLTG